MDTPEKKTRKARGKSQYLVMLRTSNSNEWAILCRGTSPKAAWAAALEAGQGGQAICVCQRGPMREMASQTSFMFVKPARAGKPEKAENNEKET